MIETGRLAQLRNLGDFLALPTDRQGVALIDTSPGAYRRWTFAELDCFSAKASLGLRAEGLVAPGDRVAILSENCAEYVALFSATMRSGAIAVPINHQLPIDQIARLVAEANIGLIGIGRNFDVAKIASSSPNLRIMHLHGDGEDSLNALVARAAFDGDRRPIKVASTDCACILYTSGSTGAPKGVMLTHGGQLWALARTSSYFPPSPGVMTVMAAPFYHMNGLFITMNCIANGIGVVLMPRFQGRTYLELVAAYRCALLTGIPAMFAMALRKGDLISKHGYSFVDSIILGSSPLSKRLADDISRAFPNARIRNSFGTTEAGAYVFGPHPDGLATPSLSLGYPAAGVEIELFDGLDAYTGTMRMRSPAVMAGYLNQPDDTNAKLRDGWYCTGDVMRRDNQGFYYHIGRSDDMFVCGGENICPGEVEKMLETHDNIIQAAVVPLHDAIKGQVPVAFIVCKAGTAPSEQDVKAFALENGPAFSHPRQVIQVEALPIASSFKYDRKALIERVESDIAVAD